MTVPRHREAPFLAGRDRELAALRAALDAALAGQGSLVLIGGDAGIGKTTLAEAVCAEAAPRGALVLVGRCYDLSETPPYGPWAEAFGRALRADGPPPPDLAGGAGAASQAALFAAVRDYLAALATRRPLVLFLDDLHWADPASLDLLRVLGRHLADLPLLALATYRADELTRGHPLYALLPLLVREARAERVDLRPLDEAGLRALVAGRYALPPADEDRLVAYLRERAEGNPFFAGELLRTLVDDGVLRQADDGWALGDLAAVGVPPLLRQMLDARVDRLGEDARELLAVAAVVGQEVPFDLWGMVAEADEGALLGVAERAVGAGLLAEAADGSGVRFAHALVREALYEGTPALRRRALHRRIGELLAALPTADLDAVAYHFERAGDARAAAWLVRAGERAERAHAWLTAADRYEAALRLPATHDDAARERAWLLYRLARLRRYAEPQRSIADLDEAARMAALAGDPALVGYARFDRGHLLCLAGQVRQGLAEMAAGDAGEERPADQPGAGLGAEGSALSPQYRRSTRILWLGIAGRYDEATALANRLLDGEGAAVGLDALACGNAYHGLGLAHAGQGRAAAAHRAFEQAAAAYGRIEHRYLFTTARVRLFRFVVLPYRTADLAGRERLAAELEATLARASGATGDIPPRLQRLPLQLLEGRWSEAEALALAGQAPGRVLGMQMLGAHVRAQLALYRGEPDLAWATIRAWLPAGPATPPGDGQFLYALPLLRVAAVLACDAGDLSVTRSWLEAHDRWLAWAGAALGRAEGALGWAAYHRAAGDLDAAREHAEAALAHATEPRQPLALLAAHRTLGELAISVRQHGEAASHLDAALALADACAAPYERALALLALAGLRTATGERAAASAVLAEARTILEPLGAKPALARADALAVKLKHRTAATPANTAGLSAREVEVLRLVAEGLTDAQVAERLFLSPRTVGQHLRSVYNKLGVENRAAATRFAVEHHLA